MNDAGQDVLRLLEESRKFAERLMLENSTLRAELAAQREQGGQRLADRRRIEVEDELMRTQNRMVLMQYEMDQLRAQYNLVREENDYFVKQHLNLERQQTHIANMYVTSQRLHETSSLDELLESIKEVIIHLIGAEEFAIYFADHQQRELVLAGQGSSQHYIFEPRVPFDREPLLRFCDDVSPDCSDSRPLACIPLKLKGNVLGMIAIFKMLNQKGHIRAYDFELCDLLAHDAAAVLNMMRSHRE